MVFVLSFGLNLNELLGGALFELVTLVKRLELQPIDLTAKTFTLVILILIKIVEGNKNVGRGLASARLIAQNCVYFI